MFSLYNRECIIEGIMNKEDHGITFTLGYQAFNQ